MAEKFRFFDATQDEDGQYDREYNAQEFTDYFKALVTTGVMKGAGNQLEVTTNGSSMITKIDTGIAFILGKYYENDSFLELTHDTETLGRSRIDRIVIRMDMSTEARYVKAFIKKGVPSTSPVAPTLTQTANLYEISLAQVKVVGGQTFTAEDAVTDERGKDVICPWAGSNILPNFNDESLENVVNDITRLKQEIENPEEWIEAVLVGSWNKKAKLHFFKGIDGVVHLKGTVKGGVSGTMTTLPVGYRPPTGITHQVVAWTGDAISGYKFYVSDLRITYTGVIDFGVVLGSGGSYLIDTYFKTK